MGQSLGKSFGKIGHKLDRGRSFNWLWGISFIITFSIALYYMFAPGYTEDSEGKRYEDPDKKVEFNIINLLICILSSIFISFILAWLLQLGNSFRFGKAQGDCEIKHNIDSKSYDSCVDRHIIAEKSWAWRW